MQLLRYIDKDNCYAIGKVKDQRPGVKNRSLNIASVLSIPLIALTAVGPDGTALNWEVDEVINN